MAQILINIGAVANDGTGDTLRAAFANTNNNFTELYSLNQTVSNKANNIKIGRAHVGTPVTSRSRMPSSA